MPGIKITQFGGINPSIDPKLLPDKFATVAINCDLRTGKLRPWPVPVQIGVAPSTSNLDIGIAPMYPPLSALGNRAGWLGGPAYDQDFVLQNIEGTAEANYGTSALPYRNQPLGRVFYRSGQSGFKFRPVSSQQEFDVGVSPGPLCSSVTVSGTPIADGIPFATAYCATYVDNWGGEGAPGPPVVVPQYTLGQKITVVVSDSNPGHTVGLVRIYRCVSDFTSGEDVANIMDTSWHLVSESPSGSGIFSFSFGDTILDHKLPGDTLISKDWFPPPTGRIAALCKLEGGWLVLVMRDGRVAISQRHQWHAWPGRNIRQLPSNNVVHAVAWKDTIIVTFSDRGAAYISVRAEGPGIAVSTNYYREEFISFQTSVEDNLLAIDKNLTATPFGACYASPEGFVTVGPEGAIAMATKGLILPSQFNSVLYTTPVGDSSIGFVPSRSIWHKGFLISTCGAGNPSYKYTLLDLPDDTSGSFADAALTHLDFSSVIQGPGGRCIASDRDRVDIVAAQSGTVYAWHGLDAGTPTGSENALPYRWLSKVFVLPQLTEFAAFKVTGFIVDNVRVKIWMDRRLVIDRIMNANTQRELFQKIARLPAGYKGTQLQFELSGTGNVDEFHIATSLRELGEQ